MALDSTDWQTRVKQVMAGLRPIPDPAEADVTHRLLRPDIQETFRRLPIHDRRHLVGVALQLEQVDPLNVDLIRAGLLHDIGKADANGYVRLVERILKVILEQFSPRLLAWLARPGNSTLRHGLQLAVHHAALGAALAERHGCSERTVWLIKNHETPDTADGDLQLLKAIDRATP